MCVSACPYKKVYFNWKTGKSEKCILCYPRIETGEAPACFHACVGRIRYLGVLLYDADRIAGGGGPARARSSSPRSASSSSTPRDPEVAGGGAALRDRRRGVLDAARRSPGLHAS